MKYLYNYKALRKEEIDAGNILIPKSQGPFRSDPYFGIDMYFRNREDSQHLEFRLLHTLKEQSFMLNEMA